VFIAGDDAEAKKTLSEIASKAGFAPLDAGPLRNASVIENVAILWIHMAMVGGHGRNWVLQARGLK
jgi:8-hydroxy-5-deazaflavin:NADPH oxidoreductase